MPRPALFKRFAPLLVLALPLAALTASRPSPAHALQLLLEGNRHYRAGRPWREGQAGLHQVRRLARAQKPFAVVLACSDSRVVPELLFDRDLGELFVVRVAGNVADPVVLGSIEYAVEHLEVPLVLVLGHERCGAVTAAVTTAPGDNPNLEAVLRSIRPAVAAARQACGAEPGPRLLECAVEENVRQTMDALARQSPLLAQRLKAGKLELQGGVYDLDDGRFSLLKAR